MKKNHRIIQWLSLLLFLPPAAMIVATARAQATFSDANWVSLGGIAGAGGVIYATAVDTNGNLYVGGSFGTIGTIFAANIAKWDGNSWSALGSGVDGQITSLAFDGSGNLY
ncbi:MAG TPA: hypothetical protein VMR33_05275 [Candidatus Baltobacteraceae bacterium]|jgi:hypothetical protein|nr:hypothetical protein [Candidatus Baltobacteraceae bacterium]